MISKLFTNEADLRYCQDTLATVERYPDDARTHGRNGKPLLPRWRKKLRQWTMHRRLFFWSKAVQAHDDEWIAVCRGFITLLSAKAA